MNALLIRPRKSKYILTLGSYVKLFLMMKQPQDNHKFVRHNYDYQFARKIEDQNDNSPPPQIQNYLPTREKKNKKSGCSRCCKLCRTNCEFVTVFILCFAVFIVFLFFLVKCELNNQLLLSLNTTSSGFSQVCWLWK